MKYLNTASNKNLRLQSPHIADALLQWDIRTILDLGLKTEDIDTLESGVMLQIGEMYLSLEDE